VCRDQDSLLRRSPKDESEACFAEVRRTKARTSQYNVVLT
jgi:hypothetical protein